MLVAEEEQLFFAKEQAEKNGQINSGFDDRANVQLILKVLDCFLLEAHAAFPLAKTPTVTEADQP